MRIMGIDPGLAMVGFGILDHMGNQLEPVDFGCIKTEKHMPLPARLKQIYDACTYIIEEHQPDVVAIEKLFFNRNVTTALTVGQARGVVMLSIEQAEIPITEYTPIQVKNAVTGYGKADKKQVQEMVKILLSLPRVPQPDDVADALALAICEAHSDALNTYETR